MTIMDVTIPGDSVELGDEPRTGGSTRARLEQVPISAVKEQRDILEAEHLSASETRELSSRGDQTVAGFLAVKRALCELHRETGKTAEVTPRHFVLTHDPETGAPTLAAWPEMDGPIFVSISHTRDNAYGLAVVEDRPIQAAT